MKNLLFILFLLINAFSFAQLPSEDIVESNKFNCDARVLLHYSNEEILAMDSVDFDVAKYYLVDSYVIDSSESTNIDIKTFDITMYEKHRSDSSYTTYTLTSGVKIIFIPRSKMLFKVKPLFKYSFTLHNETTLVISKNIYSIMMKIFTSKVYNYQFINDEFSFESSKNANYFYISESLSDVGYAIKEFNKQLILKQ